MITILLKTLVNSKSNLLEKILTALIIVLTKEHHYNSANFNQKCFFKFLFNILYVNNGCLTFRIFRGKTTISRSTSTLCC